MLFNPIPLINKSKLLAISYWLIWALLVVSPLVVRHWYDYIYSLPVYRNLIGILVQFLVLFLAATGLLGLRKAALLFSILGTLNPFEIIHSYYLQTQFNAGTLQLVLSLNQTKATEFSQGFNYLLFITFLIPPGIWLCYSLLKFPEFKLKSRLIGLGVSVVLFVYFGYKPWFPKPLKGFDPKLSYSNWWKYPPINLPLSFVKFGLDYAENHSLLEQRSKFKFNPVKKADNGLGEVVVLVLGESSRARNWQLFGYSRPTNPCLQKRKSQLVLCPDYIATGNNTRLSFPQLVSRANPSEFELFRKEKSIISLYREAGFETWILSNQGLLAEDYSFIATDADSLIHFPVYKHTDQVLIKPLEELLRRKTGKKLFVVVHLIGNHFNYGLRYPPAFKRFGPGMEDKPYHYDVQYKVQTINSYDNSIVFTDFVVNEFISQLEKLPGKSSLFFVADHGELIFDLTGYSIAHSSEHPTEPEVHVPFFAWFSTPKATESKLAEFKSHASSRLNAEVVFYTLAGACDLEFELDKPQMNLFSPQFVGVKERWILTPSFTRYRYD